MKRKTTTPVLTPAVRALAKIIINKTPDKSVGYDEAAGMVSEMWDQFDQAGAQIADMENITAYLRWAKFEGFCETSPI